MAYSVVVLVGHPWGSIELIKSGRGRKNFTRFARIYIYNPTILKFPDPPLMHGLVTKKIASEIECVIHVLVQCHAPVLVAVSKFKTTKINFEGLFGLSTKITCHIYGIAQCQTIIKYSSSQKKWSRFRSIPPCSDAVAPFMPIDLTLPIDSFRHVSLRPSHFHSCTCIWGTGVLLPS